MDELYINRNLSWKAQIHTIQKIPKISDSMSMNIQSEDHPKQMKKTEEDLNLLPESLPDRTFTPEFGRPSRRIGGLSSTEILIPFPVQEWKIDPIMEGKKSEEIQPTEQPAYKTAGRWTEQEHKLFLKGLLKYGKDWVRIEKLVKSRSGSQVRSHAQKFFIRIEKEFHIRDGYKYLMQGNISEGFWKRELKCETMSDLPREFRKKSEGEKRKSSIFSTCSDTSLAGDRDQSLEVDNKLVGANKRCNNSEISTPTSMEKICIYEDQTRLSVTPPLSPPSERYVAPPAPLSNSTDQNLIVYEIELQNLLLIANQIADVLKQHGIQEGGNLGSMIQIITPLKGVVQERGTRIELLLQHLNAIIPLHEGKKYALIQQGVQIHLQYLKLWETMRESEETLIQQIVPFPYMQEQIRKEMEGVGWREERSLEVGGVKEWLSFMGKRERPEGEILHTHKLHSLRHIGSAFCGIGEITTGEMAVKRIREVRCK